MDPLRRKEHEKFAFERLYASADDHDRWSHTWGRKGSVCLSYCPCFMHEFDEYGISPELDPPWTEERRRERR